MDTEVFWLWVGLYASVLALKEMRTDGADTITVACWYGFLAAALGLLVWSAYRVWSVAVGVMQ